MEYECDNYSNRDWWVCVMNETGGLEAERTVNYNIIANSQNTEKSPGNLRGLAFTQTPVKNSQGVDNRIRTRNSVFGRLPW